MGGDYAAPPPAHGHGGGHNSTAPKPAPSPIASASVPSAAGGAVHTGPQQGASYAYQAMLLTSPAPANNSKGAAAAATPIRPLGLGEASSASKAAILDDWK